ncbi:MAG: 2-C-methyl-D-erythritol 4-phosphate cytidylyltransferase [Lachnospiraceae bacterium]|nr:2-C-methyl-D-erythritol 4-phosphate cytidylyltransferase [Lachnospiraceae bacterium]
MTIAVIFAGGAGKRMNSVDKPKQFLELYQKPIIIRTLEHFERHDEIDAIVVVCIEEGISYLKELLDEYRIQKVIKIVPGGETGQDSIYKGLVAAKEISSEHFDEKDGNKSEDTIVLIHDGVRPMINAQLISDNIESVRQFGSAITTGGVTETILETDGNKIVKVPERKDSRVAKAPQSFYLRDILNAHEKAIEEGKHDYIDSCTLMQHYGYSLNLVDGPAENIKITTQMDYYLCRAFYEAEEDEQFLRSSEIKT